MSHSTIPVLHCISFHIFHTYLVIYEYIVGSREAAVNLAYPPSHHLGLKCQRIARVNKKRAMQILHLLSENAKSEELHDFVSEKRIDGRGKKEI